MLPTKGYFKDIDCPYHERTCGRPYCHFRHRKKAPDVDETASPSTVPTYKPTPKSELASNRSHIPISYVPDVVRTSRRSSYNIKDRPTYKPTPKSVLSNASASTSISTYTPTPIAQLKEDELNLDDLRQEFQLIDEILNDEGIEDTNEELEEKIIDVDKAEEDDKEKGHSKEKSKENKQKYKEKDRVGEKDKRSKDEKSKTSRDKNISDHKEKSKDKDRSRDKDKTKESRDDKNAKDQGISNKNKSRSSSSSRKGDSSKSKSAKSKDKEKEEKHRKAKHSSSSSSNRRSKQHDKDKEKNHSSTSRNKERSSGDIKIMPTTGDSSPLIDYDYDPLMSMDDDLDNVMLIEDECFKIFNEYQAPVIETAKPEPIKIIQTKPEIVEPYPIGKKRIAYTNSKIDEKPSRPIPKPVITPGMTLQNRIRIARQAQASNEGQNLMQEMKNMKRSAPTSHHSAQVDAKKMKVNGVTKPVEKPAAPPPPVPPASTSLVDDIIGNRKPRRIAPVSNVLSIQMAKARIDEMKSRTAAANAKTAAQTVTKGAKRAAHVPDMSLSNIPDVLHADRSKLPVNVRTRYLGLLADECVKLYVATEEAYTRALNEEYKCYERCSALITYRNSAMLAVNRLRKEIQEREASGLGPLQIGEAPNKSGNANFEGKRFYDLVKGFMLSPEELVLHGFPRESSIPGRALINNEHKQTTVSETMESNERLCCRCHKLYIINREGFPLFEEECCYHPLRKRTIRGERQYLCCKSTEDTGCAISSTHVSEISADRELEGFQSTFEAERDDDPRNFAVYALDCEMCYTTKGLELTRVTVVDSKLKTIFESLVKPFNPIIDYNTRFSGITAEHMETTTTNILQIQATILHLCSAKTILIGHSLESDMKALKIIHNSVVDTSVMFPHKFGLPHKRALRVLASEYLKKIIQNDVGGHDSAEDALAAMELVLWKVKEDLKVKGIKQ